MACCRGGCSHPPAKATAAASQRADASIAPYEGRTKVRDKGECPPIIEIIAAHSVRRYSLNRTKPSPYPGSLKLSFSVTIRLYTPEWRLSGVK